MASLSPSLCGGLKVELELRAGPLPTVHGTLGKHFPKQQQGQGLLMLQRTQNPSTFLAPSFDYRVQDISSNAETDKKLINSSKFLITIKLRTLICFLLL